MPGNILAGSFQQNLEISVSLQLVKNMKRGTSIGALERKDLSEREENGCGKSACKGDSGERFPYIGRKCPRSDLES